MHFPQVETHDLEGEPRLVPDELVGELRIVIVAFQRWHTGLIDTWLPVLGELESRYPGLTVWEMPALSRVYLPGRRYIDGGMSAGTPDLEARRHTLTAYADLRELAHALGIPSFRDIHLYALDASGDILWHAQGGLTEEAAISLAQLLASRFADGQQRRPLRPTV